MLSWLLVPSSDGQGKQYSELELKVAYCGKLVGLTKFPTKAFANKKSKLSVVFLGSGKVADMFFKSMHSRAINGRIVEVKVISTKELGSLNGLALREMIQRAHMAFFSRSASTHYRLLLTDLRRRPILSMSDIEGFAGGWRFNKDRV